MTIGRIFQGKSIESRIFAPFSQWDLIVLKSDSVISFLTVRI